MRDVYQEVTTRILQQLEAGVLPWVKPWASTPGSNVPCNAVTNRPYNGVNIILLWLAAGAGYPTPRFLTYRQAQQAGGHVRKGEHGFKVVFLKRIEVEDRKNPDKTKTIPLLREYTVFNVAQCDGLPERIVSGPVQRTRNPSTRDELADEFVAATGVVIEDGGEAYYVPSKDYISMPLFVSFKDADRYYNTLFHEMTHWTGHKDRCARDLTGRFGNAAYAAEELIAQLGAAFLCAEFAFNGECQDASYIAHWIKLLKDDNKAFFTAASAAQKAVDWLRQSVLTNDDKMQEAA